MTKGSMVKPVAFLFIKLYPHDIMSVSEREQAKPAHRERRMYTIEVKIEIQLDQRK